MATYTLPEEINLWLSKSESPVDLLFITLNEELLESLDTILLNEKVSNIIISSALKDSEYPKHESGRVFTLSHFNKDPHKMYCFLDFAGSRFIMNDQKYSYEKMIEWSPLFRQYCISILTYSYDGPDIKAGYWQMIKKNENLRTQTLMISEWGRFVTSLPKYLGRNIGGKVVHSADKSVAWIESLREFIRVFITNLFAKDKHIDLDSILEHFLSESSMDTFVLGCIHMTHNAVYNYESLEHLGDNLFRTHFATYVHMKFPRISNQEATGYQLQYLSRSYQHHWSDDLALYDRLIKQDVVRETTKIKTDAIEAFFGSLATVAYDLSPGFDLLIINKIMYLICESIPFDKEMLYGKPKTKVIQINETLGFTKQSITILAKSDLESENTNLEVKVSKDLRDYFAKIDSDRQKKPNAIIPKGGLSSICKLTASFSPYNMSKADAEDNIWAKISDIYTANEFTFEKNRFRHHIFDVLARYDKTTYNAFKEKISEEPYMVAESEFVKIQFISSLYENYIIMYILPETEGEGNVRKYSMSKYIESARMVDDYDFEYSGRIQTENLAVVQFPKKAEEIGGTTVTPIMYGCYQAILSFIST